MISLKSRPLTTCCDDNSTVGSRLDFIDAAKVFGIFCVVYAHTQLYEPLQSFIYVFHMPLFFFVSGFLFSYKRNASYGRFVRKRTHQLIVPYIAINLITYFFWLLIARHVGDGDDSALPVLEPLIAAALGNGGDMVHDVPLWFLLCLFIIEVLYYPLFGGVEGRRCRFSLIAAIASLAVVNYLFNPVLLPFSFGTVLTGMVFYALGHEAAMSGLRFNNVLLALLSALTVVIVSIVNGRINMHINYYGNICLFPIGGLAGVYASLALSRCISRFIERRVAIRRFVRFVSSNTLYLCGFHLMCFTFLKGILVYIFHYDIHQLNSTIFGNLLFCIVAMLICLSAIWLVKFTFQKALHGGERDA